MNPHEQHLRNAREMVARPSAYVELLSRKESPLTTTTPKLSPFLSEVFPAKIDCFICATDVRNVPKNAKYSLQLWPPNDRFRRLGIKNFELGYPENVSFDRGPSINVVTNVITELNRVPCLLFAASFVLPEAGSYYSVLLLADGNIIGGNKLYAIHHDVAGDSR